MNPNTGKTGHVMEQKIKSLDTLKNPILYPKWKVKWKWALSCHPRPRLRLRPHLSFLCSSVPLQASCPRKRKSKHPLCYMNALRYMKHIYSHTFSLNFSFMAAMRAVRFSLLASIFWLSFSSAILLKLLFSSIAFWRTSFSCSRFSAKCFSTSASWF